MINERNYSLGSLPKRLRDSASQLETQIREFETREGSPTEDNYNETLHITMRVISDAIEMTKALKTIAEDAGLQAPNTVVGAARKVNLGYSHTEKDEIVHIALISARSILNSHNRLVDNSEAEVADICYKIMKEIA